MNAYIASFMLLLFNAVGLAVPASAAAEERMIPELGSAAHLADAADTDASALLESSGAAVTPHPFAKMTALLVSPGLASHTVASRKPDWAVVAMRAEAGDKLEHEEGAP